MRSRRPTVLMMGFLVTVTLLVAAPPAVTPQNSAGGPTGHPAGARSLSADGPQLQTGRRIPDQPGADLAGALPPTIVRPTAQPPPRPTPTPTPTPKPPPPPPPTEWPGAGNTGVPAGTPLMPSGSITVTGAGTVIDGRDINGCISVQASNVTIKRTRVTGGVCGSNQIQLVVGTTGTLIEDTEVDGLNQHAFYAGIGGSGFTCLRCNIHNVGGGFNITGSSATMIQDSYVHDLYACCGSHNEDIYVGGSTSLTIRHNTLDNAYTQTSAISLFADFGPVQNVTVDHNLLNGGGATFYGGSSCPKPYCTQTGNIVVTNNHFGRLFYPQCGYWGPVTDFIPTLPGNVWSGNVWDDTGQPITR